MTKGEFYEAIFLIDKEAEEFAKDKGEFKNIIKSAYSIGAYSILRRFLRKEV